MLVLSSSTEETINNSIRHRGEKLSLSRLASTRPSKGSSGERLRRRRDEDGCLLEVAAEQRARLGVVGTRLLRLERRDFLIRAPGGQIDLTPKRLQVWGACPLSAIEAAFAEARRRFTEGEAMRNEARAALSLDQQGAA